MQAAPVAHDREQANRALLPLYFVSGGTALVYQTIWNRELHLVFGTSTFAIATILSAFMGGLALGGALMARRADRASRPLLVYGALEIFIGVYALIFPSIVGLIAPVYLSVWRALEPGPVAFGLIQFVLVAIALVLPTAAMGATLPVLSRFATDRLGAAGDRIGVLYAVNTAGAVVGTWLAGFILLPWLGLWSTTLCVAVINVALGVWAVGLDRAGGVVGAPEVQGDVVFSPATAAVTVAFGLAGAASLAYEVAWTRLLGLMLGASVYAFSVMLLAFLVGIAIGGKVGGPIADRVLARRGAQGVLALLAAVEVAVGLLSYGLMYVFPELPFWYVWICDALGADRDPMMKWVASLVLSGVVMTPPAVLMGVAFPVAVRAVTGRDDALGGPVGNVYAANTAGGALGAFAAGFFLLPTLGVQGTIWLAVTVNLVAAGVALFAARDTWPRGWWTAPASIVVLAGAFFGVRPPWDPLLMTAGMYHYASDFQDHSRQGIRAYAIDAYDLVYYAEGLSSVVTVGRNRDSDNMWLANNGKVDASTTSDLQTQLLLAFLPLQFSAQPADVAVIGMASGITAGAAMAVPGVEAMDIIEIEPLMVPATEKFAAYNRNVLADPRVRVIANDGRNHLLISPEERYDVIISEPSNPWITGVSNLFTLEFWEMGKTRLKPGGVWAQWVQVYSMDDRDLKSLLRTFATVFPHVLVYSTTDGADLIVVGSETPLALIPPSAKRLFDDPTTKELLASVDLPEQYDLVVAFMLNRDGILTATEGVPLNTDDNMRIEYNAPLNLHRETQTENLDFLRRSGALPRDAIQTAADWAGLGRTLERRGELGRAVYCFQEALRLEPAGSEQHTTWTEDLGRVMARIEAIRAP